MRSSTAFLAAASILGFAAANPLERRMECTAPAVYHVCWDGWSGCCSVSPCNGAANGGKNFCPDNEMPPQPTTSEACTSTSAAAPSATPSGPPANDTEWIEPSGCREDNSNCNWAPQYWIIKTDNETYCTMNKTGQFYVQKDAGKDGARRDSIALFTGIPKASKCSIAWYRPKMGIFYGMYNDGAMNIGQLALGNKPFAEVVGKEVNYKNTKALIKNQFSLGGLDVGNWGWTLDGKVLTNQRKFDCSGEVALHFELTAETTEASVTFDQVSKVGQVNGFVQRAGWYLKYE